MLAEEEIGVTSGGRQFTLGESGTGVLVTFGFLIWELGTFHKLTAPSVQVAQMG